MSLQARRKKASLYSAAALVFGSGFSLLGLTQKAHAQAINVLFSGTMDNNPMTVGGLPVTETENAAVTIPVVNVNTANYDAALTTDSGTIWNSLLAPTASSKINNTGSGFLSFPIEENLPLVNSLGVSSGVEITEIDFTEQGGKNTTVNPDNYSGTLAGTDGLVGQPATLMNQGWDDSGKEAQVTLYFTGLNASSTYDIYFYGGSTTNQTGLTVELPSLYQPLGYTPLSTNTVSTANYRSVFSTAGGSNPTPEKGLSWNEIPFLTDSSGDTEIVIQGSTPNANQKAAFSGMQIIQGQNITLPEYTWIGADNVNTLWSVNANWSTAPGGTVGVVPNGVGATASFTNANTNDFTLSVDSNITLGGLILNDSTGYTIQALQLATGTLVGTGVLTMSNVGSSAAFINVANGFHAINVPLVLGSNLTITSEVAGTGTSIGGNISGTGGLTIIGPGTTNAFESLHGSDSYTGPTTVGAGGLLKIGSIFAIPAVGTVGTPVLNNGTIYIQTGSFPNGTIAANPVYMGQITGAGTLTMGTSGTSYLTMSASGGDSTLSAVAGNSFSQLDIANNNILIGSLQGSAALNASYTGATVNIYVGNNHATGSFGGVIENTTGVYGNGATVNLVMMGAGTEELTNINTYSGTTTVSSGALILQGTAALPTVNVTTGAGGVLGFNINGTGFNDVENTYTVSGSGGIGQYGLDTLTITNANSVTGTSFVASGDLVVGNVLALGTGGVSNNSLVDLNGLSPSWAGLSGTGVFDDVSAGGSVTLTDTAAGPVTLTGVIQNTTGVVSLVMNGTGTQVLAGSNTYSGSTTITQGTLVVGNGGTLGSLGTSSGTISDSGLLAYNRADNITVSNNISGGGGVAQWGTGTLSLTGNNSFNGTTSIKVGGTVVAGSQTALNGGAVANNGNFVVLAGTSSTSAVKAGHISGTGNVIVGGATTGYLQLSQNTNTSTMGSLTVNSGSTFDIANNSVAIQYGSPANDPIATIKALLTSGYAGGAWTGTGIISGVAATQHANSATEQVSVGYADSAADGADSTPVVGLGNASANQVLIRYAEAGDTNMDGRVNFTDLSTLISNYGASGTDWAHGNFAYGPGTNFTDLSKLISNYGTSLSPAGSQAVTNGGSGTVSLVSDVRILPAVGQLPEPGCLTLLAAGGAGLLARRKRKNRS